MNENKGGNAATEVEVRGWVGLLLVQKPLVRRRNYDEGSFGSWRRVAVKEHRGRWKVREKRGL